MVEGYARVGTTKMSVGDAVFAESARAGIRVGPDGMTALLAYPGPNPVGALLEESETNMTKFADPPTAPLSEPGQSVGVQT